MSLFRPNDYWLFTAANESCDIWVIIQNRVYKNCPSEALSWRASVDHRKLPNRLLSKKVFVWWLFPYLSRVTPELTFRKILANATKPKCHMVNPDLHKHVDFQINSILTVVTLSGNSGVWTPYRAFDEVSKIREELENPIFPLGPLPNSPPSPSNTNNVTPPSTTTSLIDENGHVGLPTSSLKDDDDSGSSSSRSLMKGIKSEIAKLANLPSPVRSLSPENTTPRYDPPNLDEQRWRP